MAKRVAVYGGSFSPFSNSHLAVVRHAADSGEFDRIIVVPSIAHAFKTRVFPYEHRFNMACIALESPRMPVPTDVSMVELYMLRQQPGPILTIDLLRHLQKCCPENQEIEFRFVIGPDIIAELDRWERVDEIRKEFGFYETYEMGTHASAIREMIRNGDTTWRQHVPPNVAQYIETHGLYQEAPS